MPEVDPSPPACVPLCVDLDGTLVRTDTLHESMLELLKSAPLDVMRVPFWLLRGKAMMKQCVAERVELEVSNLPYRQEVLDLIDDARRQGRPVILATAATSRIAEAVADHLGVFDAVHSSDGTTNLSAHAKAQRLVEQFGEGGFDYIGNGRADRPVWRKARHKIAVSKDRGFDSGEAGTDQPVHRIIDRDRFLPACIRALRPHQWLKNLLVFAPLFAGHKFGDPGLWLASLLTFVAFSLTASFGYLVNDLLDLRSDREHARKRSRSFASGALSISSGIYLVALLLLSAILVSLLLLPLVGAVLALYLILTLGYSLRLKRQVIVDVVVLAALYTLRIIAGSAATHIPVSFWLLAFSMFVFLSLAIVKRYSELRAVLDQNTTLPGRGYMASDLPVLLALGTGSGLMSVMVLALYFDSPIVTAIYREPMWLWLAPSVMLYWVARLWMKTHRGEIHDDPVVFAVRDKQSLIVLLILGLIFSAATSGWRFW